jgi:hypothetical protein
MTVTPDSLRTRFPEFVDADDGLVAACIADATLQVNVGAWGANSDQAVELLSAHMIALSPFGLGLQLGVRVIPTRDDTSDNGSTIYEAQYLELRASNIMGMVVR